MSEPLTERGRLILEALLEAGGGLQVHEINWRAFDSGARVGRLKADLGNLRWRNFVDLNDVNGRWKITAAGKAALG